MKAQIKKVNKKRGVYAAQLEDGEFVIFELLDTPEPEIGDIIVNDDFHNLGGETFINITQNCEIEVFVEDICGSNSVNKRCLF